MSGLKKVYSAASETEAEIIRNLLAGAGIESEISSDDGGGMLQSLSFASGVDVRVDEKSVAEALQLLQEYKDGATALAGDDEE